LIRNQERQVEDEEGEEKLSLSLSCILFLKACSAKNEMKKFLRDKGDKLKMVLYAEQTFTS